ncbi:MAG TPA: hypothetical protein VMO78_06510 [Rhizomicrobium sp.]|nr:hypothetical protein [Rhizomicrobium sp.]
MFFLSEIARAVGILRRGQKKGEGRIGEYGRALRRTHGIKDHGPSGCRPAAARDVAALDRIADTLFARLLADRLAGRQRRLFALKKSML